MPDEHDAPDAERASDAARRRQHERAETVEHVLREVRADLGSITYPVTNEELATEYGSTALDLPTGSRPAAEVFNRLPDGEFDSPEEVREAIAEEIGSEGEGA